MRALLRLGSDGLDGTSVELPTASSGSCTDETTVPSPGRANARIRSGADSRLGTRLCECRTAEVQLITAPRNQPRRVPAALSSGTARSITPPTMPAVPMIVMADGLSPRMSTAINTPQIGVADWIGVDRLTPMRSIPM